MRVNNYTLIDLPKAAELSSYENAIHHASELLTAQSSVLSVYKLGGVSAPGISDIDMLVVFHNSATSDFNLQNHINSLEKYLFIHSLYGVNEDHFKQARPKVFFHNLKKIAGEEIADQETSVSNGDNHIKQQTALEFLVKMYMVMVMQKEYRIIKVRAFLLEAHAIRYDLDFLGMTDGELSDCVKEVIAIRSEWFKSDMSSRIPQVFKRFFHALEDFLKHYLSIHQLYLPLDYNANPWSNATLVRSSSVIHSRKGTVLPSILAILGGGKYFNLQNRLSKFEFGIPSTDNAAESVKKRMSLAEEMRRYNQKYLPHFLPLTSSLKIN